MSVLSPSTFKDSHMKTFSSIGLVSRNTERGVSFLAWLCCQGEGCCFLLGFRLKSQHWALTTQGRDHLYLYPAWPWLLWESKRRVL